ncbi:MAG: efflux RND transporter periplasmic adaptor subunit [Bacteroidales bacterium]|nr:efflux RND transporter periplasmic adaptor subunit [Bacteroidales bacterium]
MLSGCNRGAGEAETVEMMMPVVSGDTVMVPEGSNIAARLELDTIGEEYHSINLTTTGVVSAIPNAYAEVTSPMTGRVARVMVRLGQAVEAGSPLYEVSSSEYSEIIKNYLQSKTAMVTARRVKERTQDLYNNKVASERELDEAKMTYDIAMEEYRHAESVCREYQIDLAHAEVGQPLTVRSPIRGHVLDNNLVVGGYLKEDSEARVVVANLDKVWVKANVSETAVPYLTNIEDVEVRLVAQPDSILKGKVTYVGGILDPETRTVQTIIECNNPRMMMKPNMYAAVSMCMTGRNSIVIHKTAVMQGEGGRYVFLCTSPGVYVRTRIEAQTLDSEHVLVTSGLNEGDIIIGNGAFYLNDYK